jgi:hypothetical protein
MISGRIVDLSQPVSAGMPVFPGDGPLRATLLDQPSMNLSRIDPCTPAPTWTRLFDSSPARKLSTEAALWTLDTAGFQDIPGLRFHSRV